MSAYHDRHRDPTFCQSVDQECEWGGESEETARATHEDDSEGDDDPAGEEVEFSVDGKT